MNILVRADSSSTIGTGHIMRDLVLASQYKDANLIFATQNLDGNINYKIIEAGYDVVVLKSNDVREVIKLVKSKEINLVIIDNYAIDYYYEKELKEKSNVQILAFDDTYEKHYCNILLNHNISADARRYKELVPQNCELRCGSKYTLLRDEFLQKFPKKKTSQTKNILLAMGGVDSRELNIKILEVLNTFSNLNISVVTTNVNNNLDKLKKYIQDKKNIVLYINTTQIAKLMYESDFAIVTPSVTVNEACFMKLPFIAIKTEENQKDIYEYLIKNNFLTLEKFDEDILQISINLMLKLLKSELKNFIDLTFNEKKMVFQWRNSNFVRQWMYNREEIILKNHLAYIESLKYTKDRVYFVLQDADNYYGVVDLTSISNISAELGLYANPIKKGSGTLLMYKIITYAFSVLKLKYLYANVYTNNKVAIKLYEKFNFVRKEIINDENGKLYKMELTYENR